MKSGFEDIENIDWWHRINIPNYGYTNGRVNHGPDGGDWPTTRFGMPEDLSGKTVLDIGCYDGFFSFEAARRGAEYVRAGDLTISPGFNCARTRLSLLDKVTWGKFNVETTELGLTYDVVLFYGVLYHLRSPLKALENVFRHVKPGGTCLLETAMSQNLKTLIPALEYTPNFEGDKTNYFCPNAEWIYLAAKETGFADCRLTYSVANRATFRLTRAVDDGSV